ncbi:MAG: hypothetical protein ACTSV7_06730, partial [Candidatus Baldrarchaeia archaeon]
MAYENIRLRKPNVTMVDGYFYMIDEDTDSLIMKTDDGTVAFSYPLDTTITSTISSLEHDGRNFWSLEDPGGGDNLIIRRWYIDNYVCKRRNTFNLVESGSHKYSSTAFTVEHYHETFSGNESAGSNNLSISDGSKLTSGMVVVLGPNVNGQLEEATVNSAGAGFVIINGTTSYDFQTGDPVTFYKTIWLFNDYNGVSGATGALYKINPYTGAYQAKYSGGEYQSVGACTFYDMTSVFGAGSEAICFVFGSNMLFIDPDDPTNNIGSMVMDNIEDNQTTLIPIYDVTIEGTNVYRLQTKATYYGSTASFSEGPYNYQLSTTDAFITSISLEANPAILPANAVNISNITSVVKDQFL